MNKNYHVMARQLETKLANNEEITAEDVKMAAEVAKATSRIEDRILFSLLKGQQEQPAE